MGPAKRLLLVDDDPRNLMVLEARLHSLGHVLILARGGQEAIDEFDGSSIDLVLLDLAMPVIDGYAVLAHIRASSTGMHVPVILITAHSDREHRLRGLQAGADEFLEKPIDAAILLARVHTLLALKEARDALKVARDIAEARNQELERLQREQQELTQFIIHDLKTPIGVITANAQLARESAADGDMETTTTILSELEDAARHMRSMIDDLLAASRVGDATLQIAARQFLAEGFVAPIAAACARRAAQKHIAVECTVPHCQLVADRALLRRVLENLLENALRYTPTDGHLAIEVTADDGVDIKVSNDGVAIPAEDRSRIFDKFVRGGAEKQLAGSAGLGLYFCKRVVEAHGGRIELTQSAKWPTQFVIHLPNVAVSPSSELRSQLA